MIPGPRLELQRATKRFARLVAVDALDVALEPGRIHAIIGENGAGKSTALKLMAGYLGPTSGAVQVAGEPLPPDPREAMARGVGMVHQHFMLVERLSALENLVLGHEPLRGGRIDLDRARREAEALAKRTRLEVPLDRIAEDLGVGEQQRLEILRVLYRGARAILLDEPTAVLSPVEVADLYRTLRELAEGGATIGVVTHRLDEVARFVDDVTVMRRGRRVACEPRAEGESESAFMERLMRAVMGGEPPTAVTPPPLERAADAALEVEAVVVERDGRRLLDELSLGVLPGEVLGIAGVEGNGQGELARVLAGLLPIDRGRVLLAGRPLFSPMTEGDAAKRVRQARAAGLVVVQEDRQHDELLLDATVADNLVLGDLGAVDERRAIRTRFDRFDVYPPAPERLMRALSGGNQQKVVMARVLDRRIVALVAAQPTRGVDVGTARTIQRALAEVAGAGAAVVLLSADLNELRSLSHRIAVIRKGRIVAELAPAASDEAIGRAMLGLDARGAA
jgi:general nucleoside transport system ATP-binding protein